MQVGAIVICINDSFSAEAMNHLKQIPKKNNYYTIREIVDMSNGRVGVLLEEVVNPPRETAEGVSEPKFKSNRFREMHIPPDLEEEIHDLLYEPVLIER